jgi:hypothetical protein
MADHRDHHGAAVLQIGTHIAMNLFRGFEKFDSGIL